MACATDRPEPTTPPHRLRVGVVGHGMWARMYLLPGLRSCGDADVVALCGSDAARAAAAARELGVPHSYGGVTEMLRDERLDALVVASPPAHHAAAVDAAAAAGIAVYCEKPLGLNTEQTREMVATASEIPSVVGFTLRWNTALAGMRDAVRAARIGRVQHVSVAYRQSASVSARGLSGWHRDPAAEPHGVLSDLGPHTFDLLRWLGHEPGAVAGVGHAVTPGEALDECHVLVRLADGAAASIVCSRIAPPGDALATGVVEVQGTEGWTSCDFLGDSGFRIGDHTGAILEHGSEPSRATDEAGESDLVDTSGIQVPPAVLRRLHAGARRQMGDFVALAGSVGRPPRSDLPTIRDGHEAQRAVDATAASIACDGWVTLAAD